MQIRGATEDELEALVELQRLVFRPQEGPTAQERYWSYVRQEPTYRPQQSRLVIDQGRIVAHLRVWDRTIRVRGATLRAGGIGSVLTHPDCRGKGYARALLHATEDYLRQAGYDLGLLFTIIGTTFYARLGWTPIPLPTFELPAGPAAHNDYGTLRRLHIDRDLEEVSALYRHFTEPMTGPETRPLPYWTSGPSRYRGVFPPWGVERQGRLVAYVNFAIDDKELWLTEAVASPSCEAAYGQLADQVNEQARQANLQNITGSLPHNHRLVAQLAPSSDQIRWGTHEEMMVNLINWDTLSRKLGIDDLPAPQAESAFWQALFGLKAESPDADLNAWLDKLPPSHTPFYWWNDIF